MRFSAQHPVLFFVAALTASAAVAALALWVLARAETPFDYMVVGALAATVALAAIFAVTVRRTAGRTERPS